MLGAVVSARGLRLDEIAARTGMGHGHVGRHLRALEAERLARFAAGRWHATHRAARLASSAG